MAKQTFIAERQIRGIEPPKGQVEHTLKAGDTISADADNPQIARLIELGALIAKPDDKKPAK